MQSSKSRTDSKNKVRMLTIGVMTVLIYYLLDSPIRFTGAYNFPSGTGIKNFLPFTFGLFLGLPGILGGTLGAATAGLVAGTSVAESLAEACCFFVTSLGMWLSWYAVYRDGHIRFERFRELMIYTGLVTAFSLLSGWISVLLIQAGGNLFWYTFFGYLLMGLLVSLLVNILMGGIFCVSPILPPYAHRKHGIPIDLSPEDLAPDAVNERIEVDAMEKKIPTKRVFEIENCLEELYIRLRRKLPEATVVGEVELGTTISMRITIPGEEYNPFRRQSDEDEMDLLSLKLLRHRALRASYSYRNGENRIHIVV